MDRDAPDNAIPDSLVAIKLISRSHIKKNDRMRISIVREVEVLKVRKRRRICDYNSQMLIIFGLGA